MFCVVKTGYPDWRPWESWDPMGSAAEILTTLCGWIRQIKHQGHLRKLLNYMCYVFLGRRHSLPVPVIIIAFRIMNELHNLNHKDAASKVLRQEFFLETASNFRTRESTSWLKRHWIDYRATNSQETKIIFLCLKRVFNFSFQFHVTD